MVSGVPSIPSPTIANRNLSKSGRNWRKGRRNVIAQALECCPSGPVIPVCGAEAPSFRCAELPRTELAFTDHSLVPVHLVFDPIARRIALAEELANYFEAPFSRMFDTPLWGKFHCLADAVLVL